MAFEKLAAHLDFIEESFGKKKSPRVIAKELGEPGLYQTIARYKAAVWDMKDLVAESKEERAQHHDDRREAAKVEIIKSLDLIEKIKWRASQHLDRNEGDTYQTLEGKRTVTPGQVIAWHSQAAEMATKALKAEAELSGDDPEGRKASALERLCESELSTILDCLDATEASGSKGAN